MTASYIPHQHRSILLTRRDHPTAYSLRRLCSGFLWRCREGYRRSCGFGARPKGAERGGFDGFWRLRFGGIRPLV
ncbi:hypothetical protein B0O99DRAFT_613840 [Bisporella sp. PMI_857]|nr:hypothetical protein B0O99DRAFT_613840 [Bisporella sp. PMI_857]